MGNHPCEHNLDSIEAIEEADWNPYETKRWKLRAACLIVFSIWSVSVKNASVDQLIQCFAFKLCCHNVADVLKHLQQFFILLDGGMFKKVQAG